MFPGVANVKNTAQDSGFFICVDMKIYLVYSQPHKKYLIKAGARIMFTYPGIKEAMPKWELPDCQVVMIDSGGFQLDEQTAKYSIFVEDYSS